MCEGPHWAPTQSANIQLGMNIEGTFARRAPGIQINVPAIYPNALPPNATPSSSPGTLSTKDTRLPVDRV